MKKPKSKEEFLKECVSGIQSRGGDCEIKVGVVELETGGYGLHLVMCEFSDDLRCQE